MYLIGYTIISLAEIANKLVALKLLLLTSYVKSQRGLISIIYDKNESKKVGDLTLQQIFFEEGLVYMYLVHYLQQISSIMHYIT